MNPGIAEQARAALRAHVLEPWVARCLDQQYGGFLVDFDERWRPAGPHDKTLEHASRSTIVFTLLDQAMPGQGYDRLVRHGCAFLQQAMWDSKCGGFFARVDRAGRPSWDGLKHPHAATYAARAFVLAAPSLPPGEGQLWAQRAVAWLNDVAWDPTYGGYWGSFRHNNERYPDGAELPTPDGRDVLGLTPGFKELNTNGDAIEMLTTFVVHGLGESCSDRLACLLDLMANRLTDSSGVLPYLYRRDWRPVPDLIRVGNQFQLVHRLVTAAAFRPEMGLVAKACLLADFCLESARHPSGGFCYAVSGAGRTWPSAGPTTDLRQWWVQFEAAHAFHVLATHQAVDHEKRTVYARARDQQWEFAREHFFDAQFGGIREFPVEAGTRRHGRWQLWGRPNQQYPLRKTHGWKDPLHEVAAFLALAQPREP